jgi:hypothetical protein
LTGLSLNCIEDGLEFPSCTSVFSNDRYVAWGQALLCWEIFFFIRQLLPSAFQSLECVIEVMVFCVGIESTSMHLLLSENTVHIQNANKMQYNTIQYNTFTSWAHCASFSFFGVVMWYLFLLYCLFWIWSGEINFCYWSCPEWNHYLQ